MARTVPERPWEDLPPSVAKALRPELPELVDEIITALSESVPAYARPLEGPFGVGLRVGVEEALQQFVEMIETPEAGRGSGSEVYINLGRGEMRAGRSLEALLAAYRIGARVAWRRLSQAGASADLSPDTLCLLAESIFAYIDELSAESAEGYAQEQSQVASERQQRRRRLVRLLLQQPQPESETVRAAAAEAQWRLPNTLAALVIGPDEHSKLARRLDVDVISASVGEMVCVLIPDPEAPSFQDKLKRLLASSEGVLGPTVTWQEAPLSFDRASAASELIDAGVLQKEGLVIASDHAATLLLHRDQRLAREIASDKLAPLRELTRNSRERLTATLLAWLEHQGRLQKVAEALHVHPQTARYRVARLRELFGSRLDDPDGRFELELALRATTGGHSA